MKTDGTNRIKISDDVVDEINVEGDWIYYYKGVTQYELYKIMTDGTNKQFVK